MAFLNVYGPVDDDANRLVVFLEEAITAHDADSIYYALTQLYEVAGPVFTDYLVEWLAQQAHAIAVALQLLQPDLSLG